MQFEKKLHTFSFLLKNSIFKLDYLCGYRSSISKIWHWGSLLNPLLNATGVTQQFVTVPAIPHPAHGRAHSVTCEQWHNLKTLSWHSPEHVISFSWRDCMLLWYLSASSSQNGWNSSPERALEVPRGRGWDLRLEISVLNNTCRLR